MLADSVTARGGQIISGVVVKDIVDEIRGVRLVTGDGETDPFDAVVMATGAWLGDLARHFGVRTVVQAGRGYSFSVPIAHVPAGPVYFPAQRIACTPLGDRLRVAGMMEFRKPDAKLDPRRIDAIVEAARPLLRDADLDARTFEWVGPRPCTPDGLPLIGATASPRVFAAGGHGMWGITLGPITGQLLAETITTGRTPASWRRSTRCADNNGRDHNDVVPPPALTHASSGTPGDPSRAVLPHLPCASSAHLPPLRSARSGPWLRSPAQGPLPSRLAGLLPNVGLGDHRPTPLIDLGGRGCATPTKDFQLLVGRPRPAVPAKPRTPPQAPGPRGPADDKSSWLDQRARGRSTSSPARLSARGRRSAGHRPCRALLRRRRRSLLAGAGIGLPAPHAAVDRRPAFAPSVASAIRARRAGPPGRRERRQSAQTLQRLGSRPRARRLRHASTPSCAVPNCKDVRGAVLDRIVELGRRRVRRSRSSTRTRSRTMFLQGYADRCGCSPWA